MTDAKSTTLTDGRQTEARGSLSHVAGAKAWGGALGLEERGRQLLSRITFGPRSGDPERLRAMGTAAFLDEQLHPERLDDSAMESRLASLPTLSMSTAKLIENYPQPTPEQRAARGLGSAAQAAPQGMAGAGADASAMGQEQDHAREVVIELGREELLRAVYSTRQLQEVMVQFWMNHFNIFAPKGPDKWMLTSFERDTIRPHALGKFEDLLMATAKSPAMLFYLDNWLSAAPNSNAAANFPRRTELFGRREGSFPLAPVREPLAGDGKRSPSLPQRRGLNENYGRELMELHTLGVNGGYTQQDVIEVARCLTGWTIERPRRSAEFTFNPRLHDFSEKRVLGRRIEAGRGIEDGLEVLHILANHPSTARFISLKLCRRFVADEPPSSLVDRTARHFSETQGDLRAVLRAILTSPEFYSEGAYRAKVKTPFEIVASALRALEAQTDASMQLLGLVGRMGEPLFLYSAPTGYADQASTWISSGSLLARLNFATLLASNRIRGVEINLKSAAASSPEAMIDDVGRRLTGGALSSGTRQAILKNISAAEDVTAGDADPFPRVATVAGLVVGSPEFQRR